MDVIPSVIRRYYIYYQKRAHSSCKGLELFCDIPFVHLFIRVATEGEIHVHPEQTRYEPCNGSCITCKGDEKRSFYPLHHHEKRDNPADEQQHPSDDD